MPYIPDSVFESGTWEKLSPHSRLVYVALCKFYNRKERKAFPGISRIMQVSGCSRRSVFRALNELKTKGLIVIKKKDSTSGFDSNIYTLLDFLFFELNQTKVASARQALASDIQALLSAKADTPLVSDSHTNYIINHITNIVGSFNSNNSKETKAYDDPEKYRELLGQRLSEYWKNQPSKGEKSYKPNS